MRQGGTVGATNRQVSAAFSRQLSLAILAVVLLMGATLGATFWMGRQQDLAARDRLAPDGRRRHRDLRRAGQGDAPRLRHLDRCLREHPRRRRRLARAEHRRVGGDRNLRPRRRFCRPTARRSAGTLAAGRRPTCSTRRRSPPSTGSSTESRSTAAPRRAPTSAPAARSGSSRSPGWCRRTRSPPDVGDADLPRLVIGFGITAELLGDIGRRFMIDDHHDRTRAGAGQRGDRARGRRRQSAGLGELDGPDPGPGGAAGGALAARRTDDRRRAPSCCWSRARWSARRAGSRGRSRRHGPRTGPRASS